MNHQSDVSISYRVELTDLTVRYKTKIVHSIIAWGSESHEVLSVTLRSGYKKHTHPLKWNPSFFSFLTHALRTTYYSLIPLIQKCHWDRMGVPYFLRNLIPKREKRAEARPLLTVLAELTWVQWAQFFSGWVEQLHSEPLIHHACCSLVSLWLAFQHLATTHVENELITS